MRLLSTPRRSPRTGEWTTGHALLFIVTLAAKGNVTLAAQAAGMSRKSAYALKKRDPLFAAAWDAAVRAPRATGDQPKQGDRSQPQPPSTSSSEMRGPALRPGWDQKDRMFAGPGPGRRESVALARHLRLARIPTAR